MVENRKNTSKLDNSVVEKIAREIGFDLVGFAKVEPLEKEISRLEDWLAKEYHGGMKYMEENKEKRRDVRKIFENAVSVISLGVNYYYEAERKNAPNAGKVSRYAWGKDYHYLIWKMLDEFESELRKIDGTFVSKSYVDTGPVMDAVWAYKAGLGWIGKNSMVINPDFGSWFFIANVFTNKEFAPSKPVTEKCGTCSACIEACPTNAIVRPYEIDARKCISYLTIENKNDIPVEFVGKFDDWIFGCDICQDVCPWNKKFAKQTGKEYFAPVFPELDLNAFEKLSNREFNRKFAESPIKRARLKGMRRNAEFLKNKSKKN